MTASIDIRGERPGDEDAIEAVVTSAFQSKAEANTVTLMDIVDRAARPEPWAEGEKIPWNEPAFSRRMLAEHLSQSHDLASRRSEKIDRHVEWIHRDLLGSRPTRILDLGCGPGLYSSRLARLGHECTGIDFSPASVEHARQHARAEGLSCTYRHEDIRQADFGTGYGLVMLIFGELNVFRPAEARDILTRAHAALDDGGVLLLEPQTSAAVEQTGRTGSSWYSTPSGLFSEAPHLCLTEDAWDADTRTATTRWFVIDAATGQVTRHAATNQAYTEDELRSILAECGFGEIEFAPAFGADEDVERQGLFIAVGRRASSGMPDKETA